MKSKKITLPLYPKMKLWIFCEIFTNCANSVPGGGPRNRSEGGIKKWGESRNGGTDERRGRRDGQEGKENFLL